MGNTYVPRKGAVRKTKNCYIINRFRLVFVGDLYIGNSVVSHYARGGPSAIIYSIGAE